MFVGNNKLTAKHNSAQCGMRANGLQDPKQLPQTQMYHGRYGAPRPPCSMGQVGDKLNNNKFFFTPFPLHY